MRIQRGGTGGPAPHPLPPGKSQVLWVSIGNKQLDPPPPWKMLDPLWNLINDRFLWFWSFDFCKICWGLKEKKFKKKKRKKTSDLFLSDWPGPPLTKNPRSAHAPAAYIHFSANEERRYVVTSSLRQYIAEYIVANLWRYPIRHRVPCKKYRVTI